MRIRTAMAVALLLSPLGAAAQLVGSEFQVNRYTINAQNRPAVAAGADGAFVVVWASDGQDGDNRGVFGQRFDNAGQAAGTEFQVSTYTVSYQFFPTAAAGADGAFVVAWQSYQGNGGYEIFAQRFDNGGAAVGTEFRVNSYTASYQILPAAAATANGAFVVVWISSYQDGDYSGVFGQRYDSAGQAAGTEFQVTTYTIGAQFFPAIGMAADGAFVATWTSGVQDADGPGVFARRYDSAGQSIAAEFQVNTYTLGTQFLSAVATAVDGTFVVAWSSDQDGSNSGVFARRYDSAGLPVGSEFQVNSFTQGVQNYPAVAIGTDGAFAVTWQHDYTSGEVHAQHYDSEGQAVGTEFQVNTYTLNVQTSPAIAVGAAGSFTVVWQSVGQDGDSNGVFGQRITQPPTGSCPATPSATCVNSIKAQLQLKLNASDTKDKLKWKFSGGPLLGQGDFGDPTTTATYALCLYDDGALKAELEVGPSNTLWAPVGTKGYQYKDPNGSAAGVTKLKLLGGDAGKSKVQLKGKGANLPMPTPVSGMRFFAQTSAVVAQLREANGDCYQSAFTDTETSKNDGVQYKAKK